MNSAEKIKQLRNEKGLTMKDVAKAIGVSVPAIAKYEDINNPRIPKNDILKKLAQFYNVDIEYLLNEKAENVTNENIKINDILGLDDETIDTIKKLKNQNKIIELSKIMNNVDFISIVHRLEQAEFCQNGLIYLHLYLELIETESEVLFSNQSSYLRNLKNADNEVKMLLNKIDNAMVITHHIMYKKHYDNVEEIEQLKEYVNLNYEILLKYFSNTRDYNLYMIGNIFNTGITKCLLKSHNRFVEEVNKSNGSI